LYITPLYRNFRGATIKVGGWTSCMGRQKVDRRGTILDLYAMEVNVKCVL